MLRVAANDLDGAALEDVVAEISAVAETCLALACRVVAPEGLAVVALGKLGGAELNYASDVDVVFVHAGSGPERQDEAERWAATIIRLLSEPTAEGIALRVDPTLRPGGRAGVLSRSLEAMREYYASQAATWERQALIKARAVAGDMAIGADFVRMIEPFVYPEHLAPQAIDEVRRVKVRLEEYVRARGKAGTEVKRGRGGIRDIEFAVQLLQIVHGRRDERLREPNTLRALAALAAEGYVAEADARALADAYRFLRTLEHRLQIVRDLQTHDLPADGAARTTLARSLGLEGAEALQAEYERTTTLVRGLHERLFYRPLLEAFAGPTAPHPGVEREATEELLEGLGFAQPSTSYEVLRRLVDPSTRMGKVLAHVFPVMAPALALAANPDAALVRLERVAEAATTEAALADVLANDPGAARRLAHAVGASSFATDLLAVRPSRVLALEDRGEPEDAQAALVSVVARAAARELGPKETGLALAAVADRVVREAVDAAMPELPFAVVGLGKLGAEELNVASDLDVVFVYEGEGAEEFRLGSEAAERVLAGIRGAGWEPDADLRPEGRSGPLAKSFAAYLEYWERYAETWEFQSLLRARLVAGDETLGLRFCSFAAGLRLPRVPAGRARRRDHPDAPADRARACSPGRGRNVPLQARTRLSRRRSVRRRALAHAARRCAPGGPHASHARCDRGARRGSADGGHVGARARRGVRVPVRCQERTRDGPTGPRRGDPAAAPEEQVALARRLGYEEYPRRSFFDDYLRITRRARRAMLRVFREVEG